MFMSAEEYRDSLRRYKPRVFVDGESIASVADAPSLRPGINALGVSYDFALRPELAPLMQAALHGAAEIGFTIISLTLSLIAVLIPLLFMGDVVGRLVREFAITLAVSILISAVVSSPRQRQHGQST